MFPCGFTVTSKISNSDENNVHHNIYTRNIVDEYKYMLLKVLLSPEKLAGTKL